MWFGMKSCLKFSFVLFLSILMPVFIAEAQESKLSATLESGIGQFKHENYDEALPLLQQARKEDPTSTLAAFYLGLTYKQLQDYRSAIPHLKEAVTGTPKIIGALIELIDSLYQVDELEQGMTWIAEAEKEGLRPAQVAFLKGLLLLKQDKNQEAITSFKKAKELDKAMEQSCDYQIGIAHLKTKEFNYAQDAFKKVIVREPLSSMAKYASEYLNALTRREEGMRKWKMTFGMAWQYDDNIVLKPDTETAAVDISDKADSRQVFTGNLEYNHQFSERLGFKGQYLFYFAKQNDLGFYDTMSHSIVAQPNIFFPKSLLSFPVTYTQTLVNDSSYLSTPTVSSVYNFMAGNAQMGQVFLTYGNKDFLWTPSSEDENRDGNELCGGMGWYWFFSKRKGFLNLRYDADKEWAKGNNWESFGNRMTTTLTAPIVDKLKMTLSASALFQKFSNTHSVFNLHRSDTVYTVSSLLAYEFHKDWELQAQHTYIKDDSNIDVYSYSRNISSVGLQFKF